MNAVLRAAGRAARLPSGRRGKWVMLRSDMGKAGWSDMKKVADQLRATAGEGLSGVSVHVTGPAGGAADQADSFSGIDGALLIAALGVVIVMLLLTYRSPVLWLLP